MKERLRLSNEVIDAINKILDAGNDVQIQRKKDGYIILEVHRKNGLKCIQTPMISNEVLPLFYPFLKNKDAIRQKQKSGKPA